MFSIYFRKATLECRRAQTPHLSATYESVCIVFQDPGANVEKVPFHSCKHGNRGSWFSKLQKGIIFALLKALKHLFQIKS